MPLPLCHEQVAPALYNLTKNKQTTTTTTKQTNKQTNKEMNKQTNKQKQTDKQKMWGIEEG